MWKGCQDYGISVGVVNQARGNLEAMKTAWETEHGTVRPSTVGGHLLTLGDPYNAFGRHNTPYVPRASVRVKPTSSSSVALTITPDALGGVVRGITKVATGTWQIALDNRLQLFFGNPRPVQTSNTVTRFCQVYGAVVNAFSVGFVIGCYDLNAGDFVLTDFEFSATLYSYA